MSKEESDWGFETLQIHAGQKPDAVTGARNLPIYQTTAYQFRDTQHAANLFGIAELGNVYTRINNPTQDAVEQRLAALEGGVGALLVASGMAATAFAIMNVEVTFVEDAWDLEAWRRAVRPNTKAFFGEGISNPLAVVLDIEGIGKIAHEVGVPWIVDNTIATPYLTKPIDYGADIVTHAATKFLSGHGNAMVGAIIDSGNFDFARYPEKFKGFNQPDNSYNGLVYAETLGVGSAFGANLAFIFKARLQLLRDIGASVSPFNAWLLAHGLETLSLRMQRHIENTQVVAEWLEQHPNVESVSYAGLTSSKWHALAKKYAPKGPGAVLSFELKGGIEAGKKFVEGLKLFSHVANIGDVRSLVIHPASTTHSQLNEKEQQSAGITPGLVRLSIGLENLPDIKADLEVGFAASRQGL
jgi:O-acetylhomoserine (thiol)-lyase